MLKIISPRRAERILEKNGAWIGELSERYGIPDALLRAVLYKEMTEIDLLDLAADLVVAAGVFAKKDSSTGYAQIFGKTGVESINFAVGRGLTSYRALGLPCSGMLDPNDPKDVRMVWKRLRRDRKFNLEVEALTLLSAAQEMTGRIGFPEYSDEELKLILTRYNANVHEITRYGEEAFALYEKYRAL